MSGSLSIEIVTNEVMDHKFGYMGWYVRFPSGEEYGRVVSNFTPGDLVSRAKAQERVYANIEKHFKREAKPVSDDYDEPTQEQKDAMGEVPYTAEHPDFVAPEVDPSAVEPGTPSGLMFTDLSARTCYDRAAMCLLYAEQHARDVAEEHRANAAAWMTFGNNLRAVGL